MQPLLVRLHQKPYIKMENSMRVKVEMKEKINTLDHL